MKKGAFRFPMIKIEGGSDPDPAIYCPSNGYIPDPEIYIPPVILPELITESIIFICNAAVDDWKCNTNGYGLSKTGSDPYLYEIFNSVGTLVDSFTSSAVSVDFTFPTNDAYYTVRVSLPSPTYFNNFSDGVTADLHDDAVEYVYVNAGSFYWFSMLGNNNLKGVEFKEGNEGSITDISYIFRGCKSLRYWNPRFENFTALQDMVYAFAESSLEKIDLSLLGSTVVDYADYLFSNCKYLSEVIMPTVWYGNRNYRMFQGTQRLRKLVLPTTWTPSGTPDNLMNHFIYASGVEGELEFPSMPYITAIQNFAQNCLNLEILRFKGSWSGLTDVNSLVTGSPALHTLELPRTMNATTALSGAVNATNTGLRYFLGPDIGYCGLPSNSGLISITGEHDNSGFSAQTTLTVSTTFRTTLTTFQMAKHRCLRFVLGTSAASKFTVLNTLEIDWTNSSFASTTSPQLSISAAINATEINRILTALPTVTGKTADFRYCDGYATCDPTIATAKGWTML